MPQATAVGFFLLGDAVEGRVETADDGRAVLVEPEAGGGDPSTAAAAAAVRFAGCCFAATLVLLLGDAVVVVVVGCRADAGRLEAAATAAGGRAEADDGRVVAAACGFGSVRVLETSMDDDDDLWEGGAFHTGALAAAGFAFFSSTCGLLWGLVATALGASTAQAS